MKIVKYLFGLFIVLSIVSCGDDPMPKREGGDDDDDPTDIPPPPPPPPGGGSGGGGKVNFPIDTTQIKTIETLGRIN